MRNRTSRLSSNLASHLILTRDDREQFLATPGSHSTRQVARTAPCARSTARSSARIACPPPYSLPSTRRVRTCGHGTKEARSETWRRLTVTQGPRLRASWRTAPTCWARTQPPRRWCSGEPAAGARAAAESSVLYGTPAIVLEPVALTTAAAAACRRVPGRPYRVSAAAAPNGLRAHRRGTAAEGAADGHRRRPPRRSAQASRGGEGVWGEPPRRPISPPDDARRRVAVDDTTPPCGTTAGAARGDPGSRGFVLACSHACIATAARPTAVQRGIFCAAGLRGDGGGLWGPVGRHGAAARVVGAVGSGAGWRGSEHRGATRRASRRGGAAARSVSRLSWRIVCGPQAVVGGINSS